MTVEKIRADGNENFDNFPVGMRVLAVDDDPICLKLLETLLRKCQYHVTATSQARMALKMLRENRDRFDLVISDVHMPDMDGFKLLELVGLEMDLPVIMLSANSDPKLVLKGVTHGACDYLVKPVRSEELRNIWQHVIRRKKDSKNRNSSPDQVKGNGSGGDGQGSPMAGNADQNGKFNRKRKEEEDESEDNGNEGDDPSTQKKPRVVWSIELHRKFVAAVNQLGIEKAVPKRILDLMNVEGLTRENVASHLQKYRLYLKRISSVATQQANMVAALGVKDSPFIRMGPYEGFADFRSVVGQGRHGNPALSPYSVGGMLGRLNSSANLNIRNITPPHLVGAGSHSPNPATLGKMHPVLPSGNQNPSLFQGIPSSLELDQLQQNKCPTSIMNFNSLDDTRMYTASNVFTDPGAALGSTSNMLNAIPGNPVMLQGTGNLQQTLSGGGFGNQSSHSVPSFNLDSFNASVNSSSTLLDPGTIETSKMQPSPILSMEPFHSQMAVSSRRDNGFSNGPYISNNTVDASSALPALEVPRDMQFQEGLVGNAQNLAQTPSQRWGEQGQNYGHGCKSNFSSLSTRATDGAVPLMNHNMDPENALFNQRNGMFVNERMGGSGSSLMHQNGNEKMVNETRSRSNDNFILEQPKLPGGFIPPRTYDPLDDMMNSIKREHEEPVPNCDYGFDDYSFGMGL